MSSLQKYFEMKGRKVNFFSGEAFGKLRKSLDIEMEKQALVISPEAEKIPMGKTFFGYYLSRSSLENDLLFD